MFLLSSGLSPLVYSDYKRKIKAVISDGLKFGKLDVPKEKYLKFILNKEKLRKEIIKPFYEKGCFNKSEYLKNCSSGSKPGIF